MANFDIESCEFCSSTTKLMFREAVHRKDRKVAATSFNCISSFDMYQCIYCNHVTKELITMNNHIKEIHNKEPKSAKMEFRNYSCENCDFTTYFALNLYKHIRDTCHKFRNWENKRFECDQCDFKTKWKQSLKVHTISMHLREQGIKSHKGIKHSLMERIQLRCGSCAYRTTKKEYLQEHVKRYHPTIDKPCRTNEKKSQYHVRKSLQSLRFLCPHKCTFKCRIQGNLEVHIQHCHSTEKSPVYWFNFDHTYSVRTYLNEVQIWLFHNSDLEPVKSRNMFSCDQSDHNGTNIQQTNLVHLRKARFSCEQCTFKTKKRYHLKLHMVRNHKAKFENNPKSHIEHHSSKEQCDYESPKRNDVKLHAERCHLNENQTEWFKCDHCVYKSKYKKNLKSHIEQHHSSKEEWFKCEQCDYKSPKRSYVKLHAERCHLNENQVEWFKCDHCVYKSKYKKNLKSHIEQHHSSKEEWFKCEQCDYKSPKRNCVKLHAGRCHLKENEIETFKCQQCNYECRLKYLLNRHIKLKHLKELQWFLCSFCDFESRWKDMLISHIKRCHPSSTKSEIFWFNNDHTYSIPAYLNEVRIR